MRSLLKRDIRKKNGVNYKEMTHFICVSVSALHSITFIKTLNTFNIIPFYTSPDLVTFDIQSMKALVQYETLQEAERNFYSLFIL